MQCFSKKVKVALFCCSCVCCTIAISCRLGESLDGYSSGTGADASTDSQDSSVPWEANIDSEAGKGRGGAGGESGVGGESGESGAGGDSGTGGDPGAGGDAGAGGKDPGGAYGIIDTIDFKTEFVFDSKKLDDEQQGEQYFADHVEGVQVPNHAFKGKYTSQNFPIAPDGSNGMSFAFAEELEGNSMISVQQMSVTGTSISDPAVLMSFYPGPSSTGNQRIGVQDGEAMLMLYDGLTSTQCIAAIAFGEVNVTKAEGLNAIEGGKLHLSGSGIKLYHPSDTPVGDIASELEGIGATICPKK